MHRYPATLRGSQTNRAAMRPTVRPQPFKRPPLHVFWTYRRLTPPRAKPIHKPLGTFPITFFRLEIARTVGQA